MPNAIAFIVLFSFPVVAWFFFAKYHYTTAAAATIIFGYLFLPPSTGINLPLLPTFEKDFVPAACATLFFFKFRKEITLKYLESSGLSKTLLIICLSCLIFGPFVTFLGNRETLVFGWRILPSIGLFDAFNSVMTLSASIMAFFVGCTLLSSSKGRRALIFILALGGLIYSIPVLLEIRISPQLNRMIYGFHAHSFAQQIRGDGFRAMVFIEHGIYVAFFLTTATIACIGMYQSKSKGSERTKWFIAAAFLLVVLVLSKTLGSLILVIVFGSSILLLPRKMRLFITALFTIVILLYPILRSSNVIPVGKILSVAESINPNRALSLGVRLKNEDALLAKGMQKPISGWGGWGRNRVYDDKGNDTSITDGQWILVFGSFGWLGYIGQFGLFCFPQLLLLLSFRKIKPDASTVALAVIQSASTVSMIPDATISPITWLISGALWAALIFKDNEASQPLVDAKAKAPSFRRTPAPIPHTPEEEAPTRKPKTGFRRSKIADKV